MANDARNVHIRPASKWMQGVTLFSAQNTTGQSASYGLAGPYSNFGVLTFRGATGTSGGSTKVSYRLQGNIDGTTNWVTIGAATRAVTGTARTLSAIASTQGPIAYVRAQINNFTTSAGANPDKVKFTLQFIPYS